jgi:glutamate/tyrosine decarboxylase-like PLP-dependent enzyme
MKHFSKRELYFQEQLNQYINDLKENKLNLETTGTNSLAAWFLGPKSENADFFEHCITQALAANCDDRNNYFSSDPKYITPYRKDKVYDQSLQALETHFTDLLNSLQGSVPFFSHRYQAHMNWELTMPGLLGYFAAMLYNQNNVALEASPVTSQLEAAVGDDLCKMLGFTIPPKTDTNAMRPWGHITCDGSIANLEAMWAARNLKYYPISLAEAIKNEPILQQAKTLKVNYKGQEKVLLELDTWELLNLCIDEILNLADTITTNYKISADDLNNALEPYLLQSTGIVRFDRKYLSTVRRPVILGTATKHYSWPKNAAALGIGKDCFLNVIIDEDARMDFDDLRKKLDHALDSQHKNPVLMVVVVLGSTEQSAVDPLAKVVQLREEYRKKGYEFAIHVDAAWGGYFASTLRGEIEPEPFVKNNDLDKQMTPMLPMSDYVNEQYEKLQFADTITVDPHKAGYIPYPAGALCYRNKKMRNLIAFLASEVYHGDLDANMGVYGIEGSKPGAAAAAVYLSHKTIRPDRTGYGKILGKALFNSKRFFAAVITMAEEKDPFIVVPVQQIPAEREHKSKEEIKAQLDYIKTHIVSKQNNELMNDGKAMELLVQLGSDQIIITYGFNFKNKDGSLNSVPHLVNDFNQAIFEKLSLKPDSKELNKIPLIITTSVFEPEVYGEQFVQTYMERLGIINSVPITMNFISSTTMSPWLTATEKGNFIPVLTKAFRETILELVETYYETGSFSTN